MSITATKRDGRRITGQIVADCGDAVLVRVTSSTHSKFVGRTLIVRKADAVMEG
jgi:hypothetical protein